MAAVYILLADMAALMSVVLVALAAAPKPLPVLVAVLAMAVLRRSMAAAEAAAGMAAVPQPVELQEDLEMMLVVEEVNLICLVIMDAL